MLPGAAPPQVLLSFQVGTKTLCKFFLPMSSLRAAQPWGTAAFGQMQALVWAAAGQSSDLPGGALGVEVPAGDNRARGSVGTGERNISPALSRLRNAARAEAVSRGRDTAFFLLAGIQRCLDFVAHRPALNCCHGISQRFPAVEAEQPALCQSLSHANEPPVPGAFGNSSR